MNCLLVSISGCPRTPSDFIPDNGLALLAAVLRRAGHQAVVLDYNTTDTLARLFPGRDRLCLARIAGRAFGPRQAGPADFLRLARLERKLARYRRGVFRRIGEELAGRAARENVDIVGFKLWNGDGFTASLTAAAELKKRLPGLAVFGGGPQVDIFREEVLRACPHFDALVYGEGEETLLGLVAYARGEQSRAGIPNLVFRENGRTVTTPQKWTDDLDALPDALYDEETYPAMAGNRRLRFIVLDESRGCSYACNFCIHPRKSGGRTRQKSPARIVDEIAHYQARYGVSLFRYAGSNTPPPLLEAVAREIIARGLLVEYTALTDLRTEGTDFALLKRSGCFALFFGVEATDAGILAGKINKKARPETMEKILLAARAAGIFTVASLIVPAPGETAETKQRTLEFLARTRPDSVLVQFPGVIPGTEWARTPEKYGFAIRDQAVYARRVMDYQIRMFFPPRFWNPLPYRLDGKRFRQFTAETEAFAARVERELGLTTFVADDVALMAHAAGLAPGAFRDRARRCFFTGDAPALQALVEAINRYRPAGAGAPPA